MGNSGCRFQCSQNPTGSSIADKASPSPRKLCEQFLPQDILEKRIQCMSSPTNLWERKPRSKTSDRKRVRCVQVQVLTYAELDISKPGTQHHQRPRSRRSIQHSVLVLDTFSKSSGRRGGQKKGRSGENALIHPLNHRRSISPPEKNTKYNNSDF